MSIFGPLVRATPAYSNALTIEELLGPDDGPYLVLAEKFLREALPIGVYF